MGPSPSSPPPFAPPALPAAPISSFADWFLADRDTQILTQALTHELCTPPPPCGALSASESGWPDSLPALKAMEQQNEAQQQSHAGLGAPMAGPATTSESAMMFCSLYPPDCLNARENAFLQAASPPSHSTSSASNPGSPYSSVSNLTTTNTSLCFPTDAILAHRKSNLHPEGLLLANAWSSLNVPLMPADDFHPCNSSLQVSKVAPMAQVIKGKACKRRSRASRSPITVLSADVSNFRAMVQQLTGIPSNSSVQMYANQLLMKPQPLQDSYVNSAGLPTLDTSAALLRSKPPVKDPLEGFSFTRKNYQDCNASNEPALYGGISLHGQQSMLGQQSRLSSPSLALSSMWNGENDAKLEGDSPYSAEAHEFSTNQAMTPLDELASMKAHCNAVDSWLFFDGVLANQAPHLEIARMA